MGGDESKPQEHPTSTTSTANTIALEDANHFFTE